MRQRPRAMSLCCVLMILGAIGTAHAAGRNLLGDPSFEEPAGSPTQRWHLEAGAAAAEWSIVKGEARSGGSCIRVRNTKPFAPNVFGRLWTQVSVESGQTYTVSGYFRSHAPGTAWIGGGTGWQFRFPISASEDWVRVEGSFVADGDSLPIMVATESPTEEILMDDLQLERGDHATPFAFEAPLAPGEARLYVASDDIPRPGPNLVEGPSFEDADGDLPRGWTFDPRNTDATARLDDAHAHSGRYSLRLTNGTPFGAHVYGHLGFRGPAPVKPGTDYTLSAYFLRQDDGIAWIGGGPDWLVRLQAPQEKGTWRRGSVTFHTGAAQTGFDLMICTESPTAGLYIDDAKLEEGVSAAPYIPEGAAEPILFVDVPPRIAVDRTFAIEGWAFVPEGARRPRILASLARQSGAPMAEATAGPLPAGLSQVRFRYGVRPGDSGAVTVGFSLAQEGAEPVEALRVESSLVSVSDMSEWVDRVWDDIKVGFERLAGLEAKGIDVAYPLVGLRVMEQFASFVREDIAHGETLRAEDELRELDSVRARVGTLLDDYEAGRAMPPVPRYTTSPIRIEDGAFLGRVAWPDGRIEENWPVTFTGYGAFDSVKRDIEIMPDYGMNIIQIEMGPSAVFPSATETSTSVVDEYLALFDRAAAAGVQVNLLLSPHYLPQWAYDEWPEVGGVDGGFIHFSVDSPHTRAIHERFLRLVVPRLAGHPALHSFCLSNEPIYRDATTDPENRRAYTEWLRGRYGDIAAIARAHGAEYAAFEDVPVLPAAAGAAVTPRARYDYYRFNNDRFAGWHRWMADIIHEIAPSVPVHAKIMNTVLSGPMQSFGIDPELFCGLSQIAGNDCWKYYNHGQGEYASGWAGENAFFDLLWSIGRQPIFNSENHVIADRDMASIPGAHIRNILWQAAVHGEGASTMWVWERSLDPRSDFAGSIMQRPECAEAHGRTGLDLLRLGREVQALRSAPARVAIIYSIASLIYDPDCERVQWRTYEALNSAGGRIGFVTERRLASGQFGPYDLIIAAGTSHLPEDALLGLERWVDRGGRVLAIGKNVLSRDDYDNDRPFARPAAVTALEEAPARELLPRLLKVLDGLPGGLGLRFVDAASGESAFGVEGLRAELDGRTLVNLTNYLRQSATIRIEGLPEGRRTDLLTMQEVGETITLEPLQVMLVSVGD